MTKRACIKKRAGNRTTAKSKCSVKWSHVFRYSHLFIDDGIYDSFSRLLKCAIIDSLTWYEQDRGLSKKWKFANVFFKKAWKFWNAVLFKVPILFRNKSVHLKKLPLFWHFCLYNPYIESYVLIERKFSEILIISNVILFNLTWKFKYQKMISKK